MHRLRGKFARWLLLLFLFCLLPARTAPALDPDRRLSQYTHDVWRDQGDVSLSSIQAIAQSADGYLWLGTADGLVRFDGVTFTSFRRSNTPGMLNNSIQSLIAARDGTIWIGTEGGLVRFRDGKAVTFTTAEGLPSSIIRVLSEDHEGHLWIGTHGGGVARYRNGRFETYRATNGLSSDVIRAVLRDRHGALWVGTDNAGLNRMKDGHVTIFTAKDGLGTDSVWALHEDRQGRLWVGTFGAGLKEYRDGRFVDATPPLPNKFIRQILVDRAGSLWVGTEGGGLHRYRDGQLSTFDRHLGLTNDVVRAVLEDREGSLWIGTNGSGLNRLREGKFNVLTTREGLLTNMARVVYEDRDGNVWVATDGGGLHRVRDGRIQYLTTRHGLSGNDIRAVLQDRSGTLWIGTQGAGLNQAKNGRISQIPLPDSTVKALLEDAKGNLWIGTYGGGLSRLTNGTITTYSSREGLSSDFVNALVEDRDGSLWIATNGGGLNRFHNGRFTTYTAREGLPDLLIRSLYLDRKGVLWIGTAAAGLCRTRDVGFSCYTSRNGLPDDSIFKVLEDDSDHLWMSSRRGIFQIARAALEAFDEHRIQTIPVVTYDTSDGMKSLQATGGAQPAGWKLRNGELWFPTVEGVVAIDPRRIRRNAVPPPVVLEDVLVGDQHAERNANFEIGPRVERLEFRYTALSFLAPEKVRFKYRLEPFDDDWVDAGTRRVAHYTRIPPGRYRFSVIASNNDGVWNERGASLDLRIKPAFHQTWAFVAFCSGLALATVWAWHRHRIAQVRDRLCAVLAERSRMARELHDTVEQGMMAASLEVQAAAVELENPHAARMHLESARMILNESVAEARRSVKGLRSGDLERGNLSTALSNIAHRLMVVSDVGPRVRVSGDAGRLPEALESDLLRIGQEAIINALKHAHASTIDVEIAQTDGKVRLRVRDDGQGFDAGCAECPPEGHFGLVGMKERAKRLQGQLMVRTRPGEGTEVTVEAPVR